MLRASTILWLFGFLAAGIGAAAARNTFDYFTKAPTFNPPADCKPTETNYGVLAQCETEFSKEHYFWASMDTAVGWFQEESPNDAKEFARDHVAEAKQWWIDNYPDNKVNFASEESPLKPKGAPPAGIDCFRYSIVVDHVRDDQNPSILWNTQVEGLVCAWHVEIPKPGKQTIEMFWLEIFDASSGQQQPMPNFKDVARKIFDSTRI